MTSDCWTQLDAARREFEELERWLRLKAWTLLPCVGPWLRAKKIHTGNYGHTWRECRGRTAKELKAAIEAEVERGVAEEMRTRCCQVRGNEMDPCPEDATTLVCWPGQGDKPMCGPHFRQAVKIAEAMGFELHAMPVPKLEAVKT